MDIVVIAYDDNITPFGASNLYKKLGECPVLVAENLFSQSGRPGVWKLSRAVTKSVVIILTAQMAVY